MSGEHGLKKHFTGETATILGRRLQKVLPDFDTPGYAAQVDRRVTGLELKDRVLVLAEGLRSRLPVDYPEALELLRGTLGDELPEGRGMFTASWFLMPVARYAEEYGLDHPAESLDFLEAVTRCHTAEYTVRPFLVRHREATMERFGKWALDSSRNVRRLASEGLRPRLPWARGLPFLVEDPSPALKVLETLRADPSGYVRTSVANNLNDISRDHPATVLETARRWSRESPLPETAWIVRHALRTLVRRGDQEALAVLGNTGGEHVRVRGLSVRPAALRLGDALTLRFAVENTDTRAHRVTVDYVVHHVRAHGRRVPKVFKLSEVYLAPGQVRHMEKTHRIRKIQTRQHYPGEHLVDVRVNGLPAGTDGFELLPERAEWPGGSRRRTPRHPRPGAVRCRGSSGRRRAPGRGRPPGSFGRPR
ncbi:MULTISPECIES: DNA alkylation repair protein [unclassified Nocardiopsis]|uniref:DNA alkylation repair protein n=1 Tax=unclassified Nocardiopsis TaxID=2649073 RepID=UPI001F37AF12|nr:MULTISPECIES: DNA alkylation repair protein [unclassified Nocardiopsis]